MIIPLDITSIPLISNLNLTNQFVVAFVQNESIISKSTFRDSYF